jgi:CHAT domain-containing protein
LFHLSRLYSEAGDLARAEERVTEGLAASRELVDMYVLPQHLASAAEIKGKRGKAVEAAALYSEATDIVEAMLVNVPSPTLRTTLIAAMSRIYVGHFRLAIEQVKNPQMAFRILERARGRVAADELRTRRFDRASLSASPAAERSITQIQIKLQRTASPKERHALLQQLFIAEEKLGPELLEKQRVKRFAESTPVTITQLRRALSDDELLIEYVLADPASYAVCVSRRSFRVQRLPAAGSIRELVTRLRQEIDSKKDIDGSVAERLRQAVFGNVPAIGQYKRLTIVPDGALHLIPFDILPSTNGRYVGDDHVVSYALSGTVLQILRTAPHRLTGPVRLLAVGIADPRSSGRSRPGTAKPGVARGMFDASGTALPNIPGTAEEIGDIAEKAGAAAFILTGPEATESGFKSKPLASFSILHLALHGVADRKFPERSALVFRPGRSSGEDGLLQVREIRMLRLDADLVTLSACETGAGRVEGQEGMANLVRAFLFAGARNVAASLWEADDGFTVQLMKRFYSRIAEGQDVAQAIQSAKNDLRGAYSAATKPYFWGGFVVVGEGKSRPRLETTPPRSR